MSVLKPSLPLDHEETLLSYTDRLSMFHTGRGMERLLKDRGIHFEHFVSGRREAVAELADAIGLPLEDVSRIAVRVSQRSGEFRGEAITKQFLSPRATRYCPDCLAEDGPNTEWRFRLIWGFRHVQRCDKHACRLAATQVNNATCMSVALNGADLSRAEQTLDETPAYLSWLRNRLNGRAVSEPVWLSEQSLEQVLAASEMIGGVLQHGHRVALKMLAPEQTEEATDIGFSIYCEGPKAIAEALDTIRQTSPATAVQAGPLAHYGKLYDWLERRCNAIDPGPIRDILRDHIVKHSAAAPGLKILGKEITERRSHTLYSLSEELKIERKRLARLLKKLGEIPENAGEIEAGNMIFDAVTTTALIDAFQSAIQMRDVPDYLGATKHQFEVLYRQGFVKPLVPRNGRGSVRKVVFARKPLDELMQKIAMLPNLRGGHEEKLHPISYCAQRGFGRFEELLRGVLDGDISAFKNPEKSGIAAICISLETLNAMR